MPPPSKICAGRSAGVKSFASTQAQVLSGCLEMPKIGEKYCAQHRHNTPSVHAAFLSQGTLKKLQGVKSSKYTNKEEIYTIRGIVQKRPLDDRGREEYLIDWENHEIQTWNHETP